MPNKKVRQLRDDLSQLLGHSSIKAESAINNGQVVVNTRGAVSSTLAKADVNALPQETSIDTLQGRDLANAACLLSFGNGGGESSFEDVPEAVFDETHQKVANPAINTTPSKAADVRPQKPVVDNPLR